MKNLHIIGIISTLILININSLQAYNKIIEKSEEKECIIINVDDGDTFDLVCNNNGEKENIYNVRTIGVNAPDIRDNSKHCYYDESRNFIEFIKNNNRILNIEFYGKDLCKDPYKGCRNLVRLIDKNTGVDINKLLISKGYNFSWTNFSMIPKNLRIEYFIAEKRAKRNNEGLWNSCEIIYDNRYNYLNSSIPSKMTNRIN